MGYEGDILAGQVLRFKFSTNNTSAVPTTLAGTPVLSVYKDDSTTEEVTTGITLTVDFDARTGLNHVAIDTSADGTFYAAGHDFQVVITTGTVGGTSVIGAIVGEFSIENRTQKSDLRKIGGTAITATAGILSVNTTQFTGRAINDIGMTYNLPTTDGAGKIFVADNGIRNSTFVAGNITAQPFATAYFNAVWQTALPGSFTSGQAGNIVGTNLDATVSSRSTYAGGPVASVTAGVTLAAGQHVVADSLVGTVVLDATQPNYAPAKAGAKMDLVDAPNGVAVTAIQSGLATATNLAAVKTDTGNLVSRVGAWTGSGNNTMLGGMRAMANKLAGLTPTDLTSGGGTFDNTEDSLEAAHDSGAVVTVGGYATGQDPATLVLDPAASGHNTAGTIGNKINAAGTAGDPWTTPLPGAYAPGEAGNIVGNLSENVNVTITPIQAAQSTSRSQQKRDLALFTLEGPTETYVITDALNNPVNLSGKHLRFTAFLQEQTTETTLFTYDTTSGSQITITGTSSNNVNVTLKTTDTATAQTLGYALWNMTDNVVLAYGKLDIQLIKQ